LGQQLLRARQQRGLLLLRQLAAEVKAKEAQHVEETGHISRLEGLQQQQQHNPIHNHQGLMLTSMSCASVPKCQPEQCLSDTLPIVAGVLPVFSWSSVLLCC
jgi:hypothetical protein